MSVRAAGVRWYGARVVALAALGLGVATGVRAQDGREVALVSETIRRAIVTPEAALLPLPAEMVCGPKVEQVSVSPRQNYALIVRRSLYPTRDAAGFLVRADKTDAATEMQAAGAPELQLLLWGPGSRRAATVWRQALGTTTGYADIRLTAITWLQGTDTAIVQATVTPGPVTPEALRNRYQADDPRTKTLILRVNAAPGTAETVATLNEKFLLTYVSQQEPVAVIPISGGRKVLRVGTSGPVTSPPTLTLDDAQHEIISWRGFLPDGRIYGSLIRRPDGGKLSERPVTLNLATGALQDYEKGELPRPPGYVPPPPLAYRIVKTNETLTQGDIASSITALWMEGTSPQSSGRGLITAESDTLDIPYPLTSAVLYLRQGSLLATPLVTMPVTEFQARRGEQLKKETLKRARTIATIVEVLVNSHNLTLPAPGDFIHTLQKEYDGEAYLRNPATGKPGFTVAYTNPNLGDAPDFTKVVIGYLAGPGGRAVIYFGSATWEDTP